MDADPLGDLDRYLAKHADAPFGDVELVSDRTLQPFSIAGQQAASNLLTKASRALDDNDIERARSYVARAVRLPYDGHERCHPAAMEAHMALFCLVTDALEDSEEGDSRWLDTALAVLPVADEAGRCVMRDVLVAVDHDYFLTRAERTSLRSATAAVPDRPELWDLDLPPDELGDSVVSVLVVCRDYRDAHAAT
jgi:hypothetical protein